MFSFVPLFIETAYALPASGGSSAQGGNPIAQFGMIAVLIVIFYFFIMRPQQKKAKDQRSMLSTLQKGDKVVTSAGIYGTISKIDSDKPFIYLDIAANTTIKLDKNQVVKTIEK